ncbi:MAG: MerC domain-containing protein [Verrucomicrobiota bacterium]
MEFSSTTNESAGRAWLDKAAIVMAVVCSIHCLATPVLLIILPIIGRTFWTSADFHLWMLLLVVPTTVLAVFSGCRRHKDRQVALMALIGVAFLSASVVTDGMSANGGDDVVSGEVSCEDTCCSVPLDTSEDVGQSIAGIVFQWGTFLNLLGGLFLIGGHLRNFRLCRKRNCCDAV